MDYMPNMFSPENICVPYTIEPRSVEIFNFRGVFLVFFEVLQKIVNVMEEGKVWNDHMFIKSLTFYNCSNNFLKQWVSYITWPFGGLTGNLCINTQASKALFSAGVGIVLFWLVNYYSYWSVQRLLFFFLPYLGSSSLLE